MSFASNNSRNVANLLRYEPIDPLNPPPLPKRNLPTLNPPPTNQPPSRERERREIPVEEAFTPQEAVRQRKRTPLMGMRQSTREDEASVDALRVRLEQIVRYYDQRHSSLESKMAIRLNQLENFVMREVPRVDNSATLSADVLGLKEALNDLRRTQQHQAAQLSALRSVSSQRNGADALAQLSKEKEKSTVLFMQVVRLGDTVQKISDYVSSLGRGHEGRYQELQVKLAASEKALMAMSQRSSSGSEVLSELGEKLMTRLNSSESNLLLLGKQQVKDKEAIARLMAQNDRIGEDLQLLLRNMQADFQSKLQNRVQETVNRLMMEHEQRIRATEEIKKHLDLREKVNAEKQFSERMETKAKYDTMDALVRNQLIRKEDSIRALHKAMEDQFRLVVGQLQEEAARRNEQEANFRGEIKHVQENLRKEYDLYKNHQGELVDKITDMIKSQIDVRLATQLDLKKLTSSIAHEIVNDVNNLKEALSTSNKKLSFALREASSEAAERAGQLSHYVDAQVKKVVEVVTEKYSKMKSVFTKLAQQLRDHLQNTEQNRKNVESRLTAIEEDFDKLKNQVNGEIDEFYSDLQARLKEEKEFVETVVFKKTNELTVRVSKLQEYTNQHFDLLKAGIEDNKDILNKRISKMDDGSSGHNEEEMKNLRNFIFDIKRITEELRTESDAEFRQLRKEVQASQGRGKDEVFAVETKLTQRLSKSQEKEKALEEQINELTLKINNLRADTNAPNNSISENKAKKLADDVHDVTERIADNEKLVQKIAGEITVLRAQINSLQGRLK